MFRNKDGQRDEPVVPLSSTSTQSKSKPASVTQVANGAQLKGELKTQGSLQVEGRIEGLVSAEGDIQIGAQGVVEAQIDGRNVTVAGRVKGRIYADGGVVLLSGSHVEGDIHAQSLKIEDTVFFQGGCVMGEGSRKQSRSDLTPLPSTIDRLDPRSAAANAGMKTDSRTDQKKAA
jgi:cytoskeletal protein CcmA (bactofilin family)